MHLRVEHRTILEQILQKYINLSKMISFVNYLLSFLLAWLYAHMEEHPLKEYKLQMPAEKFHVADIPLIRKVHNKQKDAN